MWSPIQRIQYALAAFILIIMKINVANLTVIKHLITALCVHDANAESITRVMEWDKKYVGAPKLSNNGYMV